MGDGRDAGGRTAFGHPSFRDIYSFILHLVNRLYDGVGGGSPSAKDAAVSAEITAIQDAFADDGSPPDLTSPASCCAYAYSFLPSHINMVRYFLKVAATAAWAPELLESIGRRGDLSVLAVGCGACGDVLGIVQWLTDRGWPDCGVDAVVTDNTGQDWFGHQAEICKQMAAAGRDVRLVSLPHGFDSVEPPAGVAQRAAFADVVTIVKGISAVGAETEGVQRAGLWEVMRRMKPGGVVLVIDDSEKVEGFQKGMTAACGLKCIASMSFGEGANADFVPQEDKERLGFCFGACAARFGGWPVQEAFITGSVFRKVAHLAGHQHQQDAEAAAAAVAGVEPYLGGYAPMDGGPQFVFGGGLPGVPLVGDFGVQDPLWGQRQAAPGGGLVSGACLEGEQVPVGGVHLPGIDWQTGQTYETRVVDLNDRIQSGNLGTGIVNNGARVVQTPSGPLTVIPRSVQPDTRIGGTLKFVGKRMGQRKPYENMKSKRLRVT